MTRINIGIPPKNLHRKHLVAEYREIGRIGTQLRKRLERNMPFNDIPKSFTLGAGHQTFFLDKGLYIHKRFESLKSEMQRRGYNPTLEFRNEWRNAPHLYNDYQPTHAEVEILLERLNERKKKLQGT